MAWKNPSTRVQTQPPSTFRQPQEVINDAQTNQLLAGVCLLGVVAIAITGLVLWSKGFSSRPEPSHLEPSVAMKAYDSSFQAALRP
jgi:hypothetical protein